MTASNSAAANRERATLSSDFVEDGLTEQMYAYGTTSAVGTAIVAAILAIVAWGQTTTEVLLVWSVVALAVAVGRLLLIRRYHQSAPKDGISRRWMQPHVSLTLVSALIWRFASAQIYPTIAGPDKTLCVVMFAGLAAVGSQTLLANRVAVFSMILLPTLPVAWEFWFPVAGAPNLFGGVIVAVFCVVLLRLSAKSHNLLRKTMLFEFETKQLIQQSEGLVARLRPWWGRGRSKATATTRHNHSIHPQG